MPNGRGLIEFTKELNTLAYFTAGARDIKMIALYRHSCTFQEGATTRDREHPGTPPSTAEKEHILKGYWKLVETL